MTLSISPDGTVKCLWTDTIPLHELGPLCVKRASTIEFNERAQDWEVRLAADPLFVAFSHQSRAECLAWEHQHVESTL